MADMTYDDLKALSDETSNTKEIEAQLTQEGGESKQKIIDKIKKAYNIGFAKGFKQAQDKFRVDDIDLDSILK